METSDFSAANRSEKTLPLAVGNTAFLLDRMGEDCHSLQFLRELTQNAIEAVLRTEDQEGEIIWDVDWNIYDLEDVYKLCITDTGDGMTGGEMEEYINKLSSSVSEQSLEGNYGVGAKIAAATRNHEGLIYQSWVEEQGSMIHLWRDPTTNEYGLRQLKKPDGGYGHSPEIEDSIKPQLVEDHGTKVVLLGNSSKEDTMNAPEGADTPSKWISRYLNTRYFKFPDGITIRAREGWTNPREDKDRNILRRIKGQAEYLEQHEAASGSVNLSHAVAHWWILRDESALGSNYHVASNGHIAALYKDELYEMKTGRAGMARLQEFGVIMGHRRVVIYVEPHADGQKQLTTNTARTNLRFGNEPLPWSNWATEFLEHMPKEIETLIQETAEKSSSKDHGDTIRDRLKNILDLYEVSRYRPAPTGDLSIDDEVRARGGIPKRQNGDQNSSSSQNSSSGENGGTAGGVYSVFLKKNGQAGEEVKPDPFPEVKWLSVKDGTREPGDMEDRAARFLFDQNLLLINKDFRVFVDMVDRWCDAYQSPVRSTVEDVVHTWLEQTLTETVLGVQALRDAREWSTGDIKKALSEESLTAAVMPRYHVNNNIKRELGSKLGKAKAA